MKLLLKAILVSVLAIPLLAAGRASDLPMGRAAATIYNPGSGDYAGFRIAIEPNGAARAVDGAGYVTNELQTDLVGRFFDDLRAIGNLGLLPAQPCNTSQPDTSTTTVEVNAAIIVAWKGQRSPALRCVTDARAVRLLLDATTIQHALYVQAYRKRTMYVNGGYYGGGGYQNYGDQPIYANRFYNDRFTSEKFVNDHFTNTHFSGSGFSMDHFSSGNSMGSLPAASLSSSSLTGGLPGASLPFSNAFGQTPFGNAPYGSGPYSGSP